MDRIKTLLKIIIGLVVLSPIIWLIYQVVMDMIDYQRYDGYRDPMNHGASYGSRIADSFTTSFEMMAMLIPITCGLFVFAGIGLIGYLVIDNSLHGKYRIKNGSFALQKVKLQDGRVVLIDPNKMIAEYGVLDLQTSEWKSPVTPASLDYAKHVQRTRLFSVVSGNESADEGNKGFKYAATGKFLAGAYDKTTDDEGYFDEVDATTTSLMSLTDAFGASTRWKWIVGQNRVTGDTFQIDLREMSHFCILGATGTGKTTYLGYLIALYGLRFGYKILLLDGKGTSNWRRFEDQIEFYRIDNTDITEYIKLIEYEAGRRKEMVKEAGVMNIYELPTRIPLVIVIIEEFGFVMDSLRIANTNAHQKLTLKIGNLIRQTRELGIHIILMEQDPTRIPNTIIANMPGNICFAVGGSKGNAVGEYNLQTLERVGEFQVSGERYHAWPTYKELDSLMPEVSMGGPKPKPMVPELKKLMDYERRGGLLTAPIENSQARPIENTTPMLESNHAIENEIVDEKVAINPPLKGKAKSPEEEGMVLNVWKETSGNLTQTCIRLWGRKAPSTIEYVKIVLRKHGLLDE